MKTALRALDLLRGGIFGRISRTALILLCLAAMGMSQVISPELFPPEVDTAQTYPDSITPNDDTALTRTGPRSASAVGPGFCSVGHTIGKLAFPISNFGRFGVGIEARSSDCLTGKRIPDGEYPRGTSAVFLYKGGVWIGGVVGNDTLVSVGTDMNVCDRELIPEVHPFGKPTRRSNLDPYSPAYEGAISEQDFTVTYTDTFSRDNSYASYDPFDRRGHKPLNVRVTQNSYVWSFDYADNIVFFTTRVENIGTKPIRSMYFGLFMDMDIRRPADRNLAGTAAGCTKEQTGGRDDLTGFLSTYPALYADEECGFEDTVQLAYTLDHDGEGNYYTGLFTLPGAVGIRFLHPPIGREKIAYNWWIPASNPIYDFGPQHRNNTRKVGNGSGAPRGDRNKYYTMSNGEQDFDQISTAEITAIDSLWDMPHPDIARQYTRGADNQWVISIGPYDLNPGEYVDIPFAMVGCENIHLDVLNFFYYLNFFYQPKTYMSALNMGSFAKNAVWAEKIYDNPGVDSDGDGFAGEFRVCVKDSALIDSAWVPTVIDTSYYKGDGIPDWNATAPPPAPKVWLTPILDGIHVRFNGRESENTRDFLSNMNDFEGYRVYIGRDSREDSYSLVAAYDRENYDIYRFNRRRKPKPDWELSGNPTPLAQLKCRFGNRIDPCNDRNFNPLFYTALNPWIDADYAQDSIFYFRAHDNNTHVLGIQTPIRKRFPTEPPPSSPPTPEQYTDDGYLKYYEYETEITNLLPTLPYYLSVTAFDFGSPKAGLRPLESAKSLNAESAFALADKEQTGDVLPPVYIYPNPYRIDGSYRRENFEGLGQGDMIPDRVRAIHFVNLPAKCYIRIYSLDGDLVREMRHDVDPADSKCHYDNWDLITRNTQMVVSGLYYWTVEDANGSVQIGKFVIIM